jgi:hypothetical protein
MDATIPTGVGVYGYRIHQDCDPDDPSEDYGLRAADLSEFGEDGRPTERAHRFWEGTTLNALQRFTGGNYVTNRKEWDTFYPSSAAFVRYLSLKGYAAALVDDGGDIITPTAEMGSYGWHTGNYINPRRIGGVIIDAEQHYTGDEEARNAFEDYAEAKRAYNDGDIWSVDIIDPDGNIVESAEGYYGDGVHEELRGYAETVIAIDAKHRGKQAADEAADEAAHAAEAAAHAAIEAAARATAYDAELEARIAELTEALEAAKATRERKFKAELMKLKTA